VMRCLATRNMIVRLAFLVNYLTRGEFLPPVVGASASWNPFGKRSRLTNQIEVHIFPLRSRASVIART